MLKVAINDLGDTKTLAHLLKYDSNYGVWDHHISTNIDHIIVDNKSYKVFNEKDPLVLPWKDLRRARSAAQNIVLTSTGAAKATTETIPALN